jgi:ribonuclease T2
MKFLNITFALLFLCLSYLPPAYAADFDYYKLAISYSPSFCTNAENNGLNYKQCRTNNGVHFVLHGFWPQRENGWPENCPSQKNFVPSRIAKKFRDIIPDKRAIQYQWRKHGVCSDLDPEAYLNLARQAVGKLDLTEIGKALDGKPELDTSSARQILLQSNPGLNKTGFVFHCENNIIQDIRFCLTKALQSRPCRPARDESCSF